VALRQHPREEQIARLLEINRQMRATYRAAPRRNRLAVQLVIANLVMWPFVSLLIFFGG